MPEMQQEPAQDAAPQENSGGGGAAQAFVQTDAMLAKVVKAAQSTEQVPDEAKQAFGAALEAFRSGLQILMEAARGGGQQGGGAVSPEAGGAAGAVPESPAGVQR